MNATGDIAELAFIHEAYKRGYKAFIPYSHDTKVDVVLKRNNEPLISVQVKKGSLQKNPPHLTQTWKALVGSCKSSNRITNGKPRFTKYVEKDFDLLAVYIAEKNKWIIHRLDDVAGKASVRWNKKLTSDNWNVLTDYFNT